MVGRLIVRPLAEADIDYAARWYDEERPGFADRFLSDVDQTFAAEIVAPSLPSTGWRRW